ncbi:hypothetical protein [Methylorubrum extorquens]|nr:hypothetical protein [Methylorubrum extorquens]MCP1545964.1 hypothetical protein [Methylorubrum extorquens]MCP1591914.1 hypothetical protein [Methylorubrum extorquens]
MEAGFDAGSLFRQVMNRPALMLPKGMVFNLEAQQFQRAILDAATLAEWA